ncbi:unnamed protein product [Phaeothamnion confervicola]
MAPVPRATVQAFYQAYVTRDPAQIAPFIDDDVLWIISGPVDVLRFCGERRGKAQVMEMFDRLIPETFEVNGFNPEALLIDGDRAAMLGTLFGRTGKERRKISYRVAQFMRFRDGKIVEFRSILDSFDAAEQILGHALDVSHTSTTANDRFGIGDLVAV